MNRRRAETGAALILVVWMVAALSVMVAGAVSISRVEVDQTTRLLHEAKVFTLGRGLAALVLLDRAAHIQDSDALVEDGEFVEKNADESAHESIFRATYDVDGLQVFASVYPTSGFVSISEKDPVVWTALLSTLGGLEQSMAMRLADNIVASDVSASVGANARSFAAARRVLVQTSGFVEQLLGVDGMTREVYDRIKRSISPFPAAAEPDLSSSPPELVASLMEAVSDKNPIMTSGLEKSSQGDFCVELVVTGLGERGFTQRVWVQNFGGSRESVLRLIRAERALPYRGEQEA